MEEEGEGQSPKTLGCGSHVGVEVWAVAEGPLILVGETKVIPQLLTEGSWEILQPVRGQIELTEAAQVSNLRGYGV